jgi:hypothetical protein
MGPFGDPMIYLFKEENQMANICPNIVITSSQVDQISKINRGRFDNKYSIPKDDTIITSSPKVINVNLTPTGSCVVTASHVKFAYEVKYDIVYDVSLLMDKLSFDEIVTYGTFDVGFIWLDENEISKISIYDSATNMKNYLEISKGGL